MKAMILAAGKGTRLGELTQHTPKPLIDLGGTTPLHRTLNLLAAAGYHEVVVNVSHLGEQIKQALATPPQGMTITVSDEGPEPLETAGGIIHALPHLGKEPFLCVNGDVVWDEERMRLLRTLPARFNPKTMNGLLAILPKGQVLASAGKGDFFQDSFGRLDFAPPGEEAPYMYMCVQVLNPAAFAGLAPGKRGLSSLYREWAQKGRLHGALYTGKWVDMGSPAGLEAARTMLAARGG